MATAGCHLAAGNDHSPAVPTPAPSDAGDEPWLQRRFLQHHPNPQLAAEEQEELVALVEAFLLFLHRAGLALGLCTFLLHALVQLVPQFHPEVGPGPTALPAIGGDGQDRAGGHGRVLSLCCLLCAP